MDSFWCFHEACSEIRALNIIVYMCQFTFSVSASHSEMKHGINLVLTTLLLTAEYAMLIVSCYQVSRFLHLS